MNASAAQHRRRAVTAITVTVSMTLLLGMTALAVDVGQLYVVRSEMQVSADAAALAGANALLDPSRLGGAVALNDVIASARSAAADYAHRNIVFGAWPLVDLNSGNSPGGQIVLGHLSDLDNRTVPLDLTTPSQYNAVQVNVLRDEGHNGSIPFLFAQVFSYRAAQLESSATAAFQDGVSGYHINHPGGTAQLLPMALKDTAWHALMNVAANGSNDHYNYDPDTHAVSNGSDGIPELNLYPGAGAGQLPPGNFGTVDVGAPNNSTADLARQIRYGVNESDLAYFGGTLQLGSDGTLLLNGDTGLSAGIKDDLAAIIGQPRAIAIFRSVTGNGNNAYYTVTGFAGVRIMYVKLTGSMNSKQVIIQPAIVVDESGIGSSDGNSYSVSRPVELVR